MRLEIYCNVYCYQHKTNSDPKIAVFFYGFLENQYIT